jgi:hypothetical protein
MLPLNLNGVTQLRVYETETVCLFPLHQVFKTRICSRDTLAASNKQRAPASMLLSVT